MEKHTFTAAVRGYHYYRRFWQPKENEKLICLHEPGNAFDRFAIKTVSENGETVGHLPKEISRITNYFLDRGASMYRTLSSEHYRRFPLVHKQPPGGVLEISVLGICLSWKFKVCSWNKMSLLENKRGFRTDKT